jgi:hypothetical protein
MVARRRSAGRRSDSKGRRRRRPSPADLAHHAGNTLSALKLRLDLVITDSTCWWAQQRNLSVMATLLQDASRLIDTLELQLRGFSSSHPHDAG